MDYNNKIAIGTAQFGLDYGVANKTGKLSISEIKKILKFAKSRGVDTIDTASSYGDCEKRHGKIGVRDFNVITKLPVTQPSKNAKNWVITSFKKSTQNLKLKKVYGLLVHNTKYLLSPKTGPKIYKALLHLKRKGTVQKIGASIYTLNELKNIISKYEIDIVLAPFNIFDQRIISSKILMQLKKKKIEVYTRSSFLQGLLLMNKKNRPYKFNRWNNKFNLLNKLIIKIKKTALELCLNFVFYHKGIHRVIIGVDSFNHFKGLTEVKEIKMNMNLSYLNCNKDRMLINPSKWNNL